MAVCNELIIVSGGGISETNGTYLPFSTNSIQGEPFTIYTKDGADSYPRIMAIGVFSDRYQWAIYVGNPAFGGGAGYYSGGSFFRTTDSTRVDCPSDVPLWASNAAGSSPMPTITLASESKPLSFQQRRKIYIRKQIKLGNKRGATLK